MYIGDIYIPYVSEFSANKTTKESKETNFISGDADLDETAPKLKELTIAGVAAAYGSKTSICCCNTRYSKFFQFRVLQQHMEIRLLMIMLMILRQH